MTMGESTGWKNIFEIVPIRACFLYRLSAILLS